MNPRARGDDDDETSETSASRSDEDAFEDVRATDGFEDEEIDEDEAFNEEDEAVSYTHLTLPTTPYV